MDLMESETKSVAMLFGRMNPPTKGHEENINGLKDLAAKHNADHMVIASGSHDPKKNPLSPEDKEKHLKNAFPGTNIKVATKAQPTIMHHAAEMHKQGYTHLHVVAGADRVNEYKKLLNQYNGKPDKKGNIPYNFKKITVHSTGERKAGVSGTDMRNHVKSNNYGEFKKNLPSNLQKPENEKHARGLFNDVRKGMNIHENSERGMFKALFLVGGPGSGKDVIIHEAVAEKNAVEINLNKAYDLLLDKKKLSEDTRDTQLNAIKKRTALVINGASDNVEKILAVREELDELGYSSMMVFVNTTDEVSKNRNTQHSRVISEQVRNEKWQKSQENLDLFYDMFEFFLEFDNSINLQSSDLLIKESKQNEISDICNEISYFFKTKSINENAKDWLRLHGKLNINEDIQSLFDKVDLNEKTYSTLLRQRGHKNYTGLKQRQDSKLIKDNNSPRMQALNKIGKVDDVRDGDVASNKGYANGGYYEQSEPTLKINPSPKVPKFDTDKETKHTKGKTGVTQLPGKVQNGTGIGDTYDNRTSGSVYPMSGLGNVTYRESFSKFRGKLDELSDVTKATYKDKAKGDLQTKQGEYSQAVGSGSDEVSKQILTKIKSRQRGIRRASEAIDDPGASDMSMVGGMGNGVNKEPLQTPQDVANTRTENKRTKKKIK